MNKLKQIFNILIILYFLSACSSQYSEADVKSTITSFLENRYDYVSFSNIEERNVIANNYYSSSLLKSESSFLNNEQYMKGVEYYKETGYTSVIISLRTDPSPNQSNRYVTHVAVLYFTNEHDDDNVVNYIFEFTVVKDVSKYYFNEIEMINNEVLYVPDGEVHVSDGVAHIVSESCNHDH